MSKIISFSISDKYLEKLRTLYPALTDNLAVKQFVTDRLESSLGNSLDSSLDGDLDGKLKTLIESELDGLLEVRLDAVMGKSLTSLSERMARLEARLDTNLDGRLDDMEPSPFPTIGENVEATIDTVETADKVEAVYTVESVYDTVETVTDTVESVDESDTSPLPNQENVETVDTVEDAIELDKGAISPMGMNAADAAKYLKDKKVKVSDDSLYRWIRQEKIPDSHQGRDAIKHLTLINKLYYPIN